MAEYLIQDSTLVAMADEIRTLSDTTDTMGLDTMTNEIRNANAEIDSQSELISQIQTALNSKSGTVGSVVSGAPIITGTISIKEDSDPAEFSGGIYYTDANGLHFLCVQENESPVTISCVEGSLLYCEDYICDSSTGVVLEVLGWNSGLEHFLAVEEDGFNVVITS